MKDITRNTCICTERPDQTMYTKINNLLSMQSEQSLPTQPYLHTPHMAVKFKS